MSRQNKVNPGMYTQRGRLTPDDAARELRKQSAIGSPHTWQPADTNTRRRLAPAADAPTDTERTADQETATKAVRAKGNATAAKAKTATTGSSKRRTGNTKAGKATTASTKRKMAQKPARKAD